MTLVGFFTADEIYLSIQMIYKTQFTDSVILHSLKGQLYT